jgi:hypothetical protein
VSNLERRVILITGMSGTGIDSSLKRFCASYPHCSYIDVEEKLSPAVGPTWNRVRKESGLPTFRQCFQLPEQLLQDAWPAALTMAAGASTDDAEPNATKLSDDLDQGNEEGILLLRTRACWYHMESCGLVQGASGEALRVMERRPEMVVTLIDDIYDTFVRLSRSNEIFHAGNYEGCSPTRRLLKIAAWREAEIHYAQEIARTLNVPFVLFAVKQPMATLARLFCSHELDWLYMSHPITAVTEHMADSPDGGFPAFLSRVSDEVQRESRYVAFEPTAIDEARFDRAEDLSVKSHVFRKRWAFDADQRHLLWDGAFTTDEVRFCEQPFWNFQDEPTAALGLLAAEIDDQIRWRDRQLVAQARGLLAIRPFANPEGEVSGGVRVEVKLHNVLRACSQPQGDSGLGPNRGIRRRAICHHPQQDEDGRMLAGVLQVLQNWAAGHEVENRAVVRNWTADVRVRMSTRLSKGGILRDWHQRDELNIGVQIDKFFREVSTELVADGKQAVWFQSLSSGVMPGGEAATYRDDALGQLGADIKVVLRGDVLGDRHPLSLAPYASSECDVITKWYKDGRDLAIDMRKKLENQMSLGRVGPLDE